MENEDKIIKDQNSLWDDFFNDTDESSRSVASYMVVQKIKKLKENLVNPYKLNEYFNDLRNYFSNKEYFNLSFYEDFSAAESKDGVIENSEQFCLNCSHDELNRSLQIKNCSDFILDLRKIDIDLSENHILHSIIIEGCNRFFVIGGKIHGARNPLIITESNNFVVEQYQADKSRGNGIAIHNSQYFWIKSSQFESNLSASINVIGSSQNGIISQCSIKGGTGYHNCDAGINFCATSGAVSIENIPGSYHEPLKLLEKDKIPKLIEIEDCTITNNRAQGIYFEGAANISLHDNHIIANNKEGICLDWGTSCCFLYKNTFASNGYRAEIGELEEEIDFIQGVPKLEDGSSALKLPAISFDNGALNVLTENSISQNHGGGIKFVRSSVYNEISNNHIEHNAVSGKELHGYHFHGITLLAMGASRGEFDETDDKLLLNLKPSVYNYIHHNIIIGHYHSTFEYDLCENFILDNQTDGKKKTIYLHIGTFKTGTSSIQYFLHNNREFMRANGFLVPQSQLICHHELPLSLIIENTNFRASWPVFKGKSKDIWKKLLKEIDNSPLNNVIISAETFCDFANEHCSKEESEKLGVILKKYFSKYNVKIICYLRDILPYTKSLYKELIKTSNATKDYLKLLADCIEKDSIHLKPSTYLKYFNNLFGSENLIVKKYSRESLKNNSSIDDFLNIFNIDLPKALTKTAEKNLSIPDELVSLKKTINQIGFQNRTVHQYLSSLVIKSDSHITNNEKTAIINQVNQIIREENNYILENFNIELQNEDNDFSSIIDKIDETKMTKIETFHTLLLTQLIKKSNIIEHKLNKLEKKLSNFGNDSA